MVGGRSTTHLPSPLPPLGGAWWVLGGFLGLGFREPRGCLLQPLAPSLFLGLRQSSSWRPHPVLVHYIS